MRRYFNGKTYVNLCISRVDLELMSNGRSLFNLKKKHWKLEEIMKESIDRKDKKKRES